MDLNKTNTFWLLSLFTFYSDYGFIQSPDAMLGPACYLICLLATINYSFVIWNDGRSMM